MQENKVVLLANDKRKLSTVTIKKGNLCDLHLSVWQQTGVNVAITNILYQSSERQIFACHLPTDLTVTDMNLPLPDWRDDKRSSHLVLTRPFVLSRNQLAKPELLIPLREAYVQYTHLLSTEN